ncbi:MAG TPA: hypothetical protein VK817_25875 [Trebonia sp.]|nr:hypothetical protein [Trebonia sp.]
MYHMSTHGWVSLKYAQDVWIPCLPVFPEGHDRASWAMLYAEQWWAMSGRKHGGRQVKSLAKTLAGIHEIAYPGLEMQMGLIHLPDLSEVPLLVSLGIWAAAGDRMTQLRVLVHADDTDAMEPPEVEEFGTEQLGPGLKTLAYTRKRGTVTGHLSYAWRSEEHATAVRIFTGCPDLGRLERAIPDIERMIQGVNIIPQNRD